VNSVDIYLSHAYICSAAVFNTFDRLVVNNVIVLISYSWLVVKTRGSSSKFNSVKVFPKRHNGKKLETE